MDQENKGGIQTESDPDSSAAPPAAPAQEQAQEEGTKDTGKAADKDADNAEREPGAEPPRKPRHRKWFWLTIAIIAFLALFLYRHFSGEKNAPKGPEIAPAAITTGESTTGSMNIYITTLGTVTPINTITVNSQVTGSVMNVYYREGQMVKKGDPLVEIDPRPYQATLTQAEGTLEHDQGLLAQARADLQRYEAALERNAIAAQQVDDERHLVLQYEGTVKADEGTVAYDQVQLSYCHIVSPVSGKVGLRLVDPGNTIFPGNSSTLVVITQLQPITVVFNVSEDDLPEVEAQLGRKRSLPVDAFNRSDEHLIEAGMLTALDNQVDTTTGTVKFRAEFANNKLQLFPNQFVNARLLLRTLRNTVLVPSAAIQRNGTSTFVYVVKPDNTVAVQSVTVLTSNEQETAVSGLKAGEKVATSGFDRLENNVHVLPTGEVPAQQNNAGHGSTPSTGGNSGTAP